MINKKKFIEFNLGKRLSHTGYFQITREIIFLGDPNTTHPYRIVCTYDPIESTKNNSPILERCIKILFIHQFKNDTKKLFF